MSPTRGATAVALGLFIGSQPIFGLHTPLVLLICMRFRLDAALAWVASNVSNPFFAPFLLTLEVQVGATIITGAPIRLDLHDGGLWDYAGYAFVGAVFVGLALSAIGWALTYAFVAFKRRLFPNAKPVKPYRLPPNAPPWIVAAERVAERYAPTPPDKVSSAAERTRFHYVRVKLTTDPVAKMVADVLGTDAGVLGEVVDVGTGRGQLPILLVELGRATKAWGVDWDEEKIEEAKKAAKAHKGVRSLAVQFESGDVREAELPSADTVLILDVLHYLKEEEQDRVVQRACHAVRPGGRLVIREADTDRGWRSKVTLFEERFFTALRFNRGERVSFRSAKALAAVAEKLGFSCRIIPAWGKTPFANVLVVAERPADAVQPSEIADGVSAA